MSTNARGPCTDSSVVCVFAKPPIPGRTKSRLAADVGDTAAAEFASAMLFDMLRRFIDKSEFDLSLWYPPDAGIEMFPKIFQDEFPQLTWHAQQGATLGERMAGAFEYMLARYKRCVLIGADCIAITHTELLIALEETGEANVVLQPADDGGYTLIASQALYPFLFSKISWGTSTVCAETILRARENETSVFLLPESFDIDELDDIKRFSKQCSQETHPACFEWIRSHLTRGAKEY